MSQYISFAKTKIIALYKEQHADVGHALNTRRLMDDMQRWNPKQQDSIEEALKELEQEEIITTNEKGHLLTEKGVETIYPAPNNSVRQDILRCFSETNSRPGHTLNARAFSHNYYNNWNPKQKRIFETILDELVAEELIKNEEGVITLTQKGYDHIY